MVTEVDRFSRTENNTVRFATADDRQIETTIAPKTCELKDPGATIRIRYVSSDPYNAQDTCDQARHDMSVGAGLGALGLTAVGGQHRGPRRGGVQPVPPGGVPVAAGEVRRDDPVTAYRAVSRC